MRDSTYLEILMMVAPRSQDAAAAKLLVEGLTGKACKGLGAVFKAHHARDCGA